MRPLWSRRSCQPLQGHCPPRRCRWARLRQPCSSAPAAPWGPCPLCAGGQLARLEVLRQQVAVLDLLAAERAVLDVTPGKGAVSDVLAGDHDRRRRGTPESDEQRNEGGDIREGQARPDFGVHAPLSAHRGVQRQARRGPAQTVWLAMGGARLRTGRGLHERLEDAQADPARQRLFGAGFVLRRQGPANQTPP